MTPCHQASTGSPLYSCTLRFDATTSFGTGRNHTGAKLLVEDHRPALADDGAVREVVEVRSEDVAGREGARRGSDFDVRIFGGCSEGAETKVYAPRVV